MAITLLIVDSDRQLVDEWIRQLGEAPLAGHFSPQGATSLEEVLGILEAQPVDALVTSLAVGDTDGEQLAMFAQSRCPSLKVIFTSATPTPEVQARVQGSGAIGLLPTTATALEIAALLGVKPAAKAPPQQAAPAATPKVALAKAPAAATPKPVTVTAKAVPAPTAAPKVAVKAIATSPQPTAAAQPQPAAPVRPMTVAKVTAQPQPMASAVPQQPTSESGPGGSAASAVATAGPRVAAKAPTVVPQPAVSARPSAVAPKVSTAPTASPAPAEATAKPKLPAKTATPAAAAGVTPVAVVSRPQEPATTPLIVTEEPAVPAMPIVEQPRAMAPTPTQMPTVGEDPIGQMIGPYHIRRQLGEGTWGKIYEGAQEAVNRSVTIKVLDPKLAKDPQRAAQFVALASRLANLRFNNLIAVYEGGQSGPWHYYAREYVEGRSLADLLATGERLSPSHVLKTAAGVARALMYLTQQRIPFGPLTDRNIMVETHTGDGKVGGFSLIDGSSGPLGRTAADEMPRVAHTLWQVVDHTAPQADQVYSFLARVIGQGEPFGSVEQMIAEADRLETSFHTPVVKPRPKPAAPPKPPPIIPPKKPLLQRIGKKHLVAAGAGVGVLALAIAGYSVFKIITKPPPVDVETFVRVPAGEFIYQNGEKATTRQFWISKYEVTIRQYRKFWDEVAVKGDQDYRHPKQPASKDAKHTPRDWGFIYAAAEAEQPFLDQKINLDCPIFNVDYYDAYAYAKWASGRLPTEQEWEKAARGTDGRFYPWGNSNDPKRANSGFDYTQVGRGAMDGFYQWAPVNAHASPEHGDVSPYGACNMAGNVAEWTDTFVPSKSNPKLLVPVIRGGSWADSDVRITQRLFNLPADKPQLHVGFRIVMDREPATTPP